MKHYIYYHVQNHFIIVLHLCITQFIVIVPNVANAVGVGIHYMIGTFMFYETS